MFFFKLALDFSYHSHPQQSVVNILYHAINKITYSLKWNLDEFCCSYFHNCNITLEICIFNSAERDYECLWIFIVLDIICFQTQKQLGTLNNIQVLLKSVLIDLCAHNLVHAKISLRACLSQCMQFVKPCYHFPGKLNLDKKEMVYLKE